MSNNVIVSAAEYALLCKRSGVLKAAEAREVVFCEACRFYCEEEGEGVCALLSMYTEGGRVVFHVLPSEFCAWGAERGDEFLPLIL